MYCKQSQTNAGSCGWEYPDYRRCRQPELRDIRCTLVSSSKRASEAFAFGAFVALEPITHRRCIFPLQTPKPLIGLPSNVPRPAGEETGVSECSARSSRSGMMARLSMRSSRHKPLMNVTGVSDPDGPRTIPAPHKIRCIYPKKTSIATEPESRDHYIMESRPYPEFQFSKTLQ